jgi:hypothetical protein
LDDVALTTSYYLDTGLIASGKLRATEASSFFLFDFPDEQKCDFFFFERCSKDPMRTSICPFCLQKLEFSFVFVLVMQMKKGLFPEHSQWARCVLIHMAPG